MNGQTLRDNALAALEAKRYEWVQAARYQACEIAKATGKVSINELRDVVEMPADYHPNTWGAVFRCKDLEAFTFGIAKHPAAHARMVRYYRPAGSASYD